MARGSKGGGVAQRPHRDPTPLAAAVSARGDSAASARGRNGAEIAVDHRDRTGTLRDRSRGPMVLTVGVLLFSVADRRRNLDEDSGPKVVQVQ